MTMIEVMEELNSVERKAVEELRQRVKDDVTKELCNDDSMFLRFLRAREFNMELAEDMLRKHLSWRRANQIDIFSLHFVPNEVVVNYLPLRMIGFDKEGSPIRYFDFGNLDCKGLLKAVSKNDMIKNIIAYFENDVRTMKEQSIKLNKPIQRWTYIFNFEGYSFAKATHKPSLECLLSIFQIYESNYPERLKAAFIINSSIYFSMMFAVIKPLLSGSTVKKISIFAKDGWKEELTKHIDDETLPVFLGGKKTDPDGNPLCKTICLHGKVIPEKFYFCRKDVRVSNKPGAKKLEVCRKSKSFYPLNVQEPGSMIEWEFETENRDIGFSLRFQENYIDENIKILDTKELIPKQRIDAHEFSEAGMYKCDKPGTYVLVFDNTYSWLHSKEIYCLASVVSPNNQVR